MGDMGFVSYSTLFLYFGELCRTVLFVIGFSKVLKYVGSDLELLYELTPKTSVGALRDFLVNVAAVTVRHDYMLDKFTMIDNGVRKFKRDKKTRLEDVDKEMERKIRAEFSPMRYGASMMKMGWCVPGWDDDFFSVLDVAGRVGSGIGSFGVDRFYVLLKGDVRSVILDVKYEPVSAVMTILNETYPETKAWYDNLFNHEAGERLCELWHCCVIQILTCCVDYRPCGARSASTHVLYGPLCWKSGDRRSPIHSTREIPLQGIL